MLKDFNLSKLERLLSPKYCSYFALTLFLFAFLFGPVVLFPNTILQLGLPRSYILIVALVLLILSFREKSKDMIFTLGQSACLGSLLYFLSDLPIRQQSFSQHQAPLLLWLMISSLIYFFFLKKMNFYLVFLASLSVLGAFIGFIFTTNGALIFTDDHPCFLYRLIQLKENFPRIPFYNPLWNAGVEAREFFASGILNVFSLFAPLIYLFNIESVYNGLVLSLLFLIPPILSILSARVLKVSTKVLALQIVLSLSSSMLWYRWGFSYGTLGFILSSSLAPLNVILLYRLLDKNSLISLKTILFFPVSMTLMFLWSPSILVFLLLLVFSFKSLPHALKNKQIWIIFLLTLLLNAPWVSVFYRASGVSDFLTKPKSQVTSQEADSTPVSNQKTGMHDASKFKASSLKERDLSLVRKLTINIQRNSVYVNPLIIFFGILGIVFLNKPEVRVFRSGVLVLLLIGLIGPLLKPQLELERMLVVLALLLSWPSAILISEYLSKLTRPIFVAGVLGLLSLSPLWIWRVTSNQTNERYSLAGPLVENLSNAIKEYAGEGRTLFSGFMLHELNGGHIAPLAHWTAKPLIASSYQHDRWKYVDVIPEEYRLRKEAGIREYFDLMNVSLVVAYDAKWKKWFKSRPEQYEEVWKGGGFKMYRRKLFTPNYFLIGEGEVTSQDGNSLYLKVLSSEALIKFNYLPFLRSSNCNLRPEKVGENLTFIRLENCKPGEIVKIESMGPLERFFIDKSIIAKNSH